MKLIPESSPKTYMTLYACDLSAGRRLDTFVANVLSFCSRNGETSVCAPRRPPLLLSGIILVFLTEMKAPSGTALGQRRSPHRLVRSSHPPYLLAPSV